MEREYWAKRGRQTSGPHASRAAAVAAFRASYPVDPRKAAGGGTKICTGYGNGGPWFDIRFIDHFARDGETIGD